MELLSREQLKTKNSNLICPPVSTLELPEKVLQFGTGVLLRGLPNYYINKANLEGNFNGRVVVVKSTDQGGTNDFDQQNNLYTICIRGIQNGEKKEENQLVSAISRVLTASNQWEEILDFAASPSLEVVISNTTEVGICLEEDNVHSQPPVSFPGKLLAVLYHRYKMYNGSKDRGLVIVPTELIPDNGTKLKEIIIELALQNQLPEDFITWLETCNHFCNSLVDRIVPGKPHADMKQPLEQELGYKDQLLIMSEVYSLWAIEGNEKVKDVLSFAKSDSGVVVTPDIGLHRELKMRLLNGTHTLSSGIAFLSGFSTVKLAMDDSDVFAYVENLMKQEIAKSIPYEVDEQMAIDFADNVIDRFKNPHIEHKWISITMNYTSKLAMRVIPLLLNYVKKFNSVPELMALGFAAYIAFMNGYEKDGKYYGEVDGEEYPINDDKAAQVIALWDKNGREGVVKAILSNQKLWGTDLTEIEDFEMVVNGYLQNILDQSVLSALNSQTV
ncbi:Mannitol dehydrogenase domain protein [Pseudopedobacter saltans DSM 12145]|uniref:Mannitol dehydrogenase domain protein n=1 Tax=Pseudopedobacter saltans (strain ATCC 51119 / DSM 12145 / JCM 21818 / CCUG 39354 / LMG 10337 / NBRC 100064 / NCIMB 13643) TaxID=762903 RepID=F0S700_PSESL|nr:tagaturonate reductase [Pseudopedobacter saltans]ADY53263.1 Mannitol dehydrogenase domain protein [Pseudopedobacter saltans DSM 12145]